VNGTRELSLLVVLSAYRTPNTVFSGSYLLWIHPISYQWSNPMFVFVAAEAGTGSSTKKFRGDETQKCCFFFWISTYKLKTAVMKRLSSKQRNAVIAGLVVLVLAIISYKLYYKKDVGTTEPYTELSSGERPQEPKAQDTLRGRNSQGLGVPEELYTAPEVHRRHVFKGQEHRLTPIQPASDTGQDQGSTRHSPLEALDKNQGFARSANSAIASMKHSLFSHKTGRSTHEPGSTLISVKAHNRGVMPHPKRVNQVPLTAVNLNNQPGDLVVEVNNAS
jgi:hypothetical protein